MREKADYLVNLRIILFAVKRKWKNALALPPYD